MSEFGWTRLAYLSVILAVLAILVKLGTFGVGSLPEDFPEAALTFAQREPAFEEDLDWESRNGPADERTKAPAEAPAGVELSEEPERHEDPRGNTREPAESLYENVNFEEDAPVFYRPAPRVAPQVAPRVGGASTEPSSSGAAKSCQTVGDAPPGSEILFPMTREHFDSYDDTWGAARPQGGHEGTDMMAPMGTPEFAMTDGTVVPVSGANANGWNTLGGYTVMIEAAYSVGPVKKGDLFYYAHMDEKSDLRIGDVVEAGDVVGYAGDTGQGPEGTRGQFPSHLHLGWYETSGERTQLASGAMNPYPLLEWIKANGGSIEGGSDVPYCEAPQSSAPTPSGGGYWQFPSSPGERPDMSTETDDAAPSPVARQNESAESSPDITREPRRPVRQPPRPADPDPPKEGGAADEPTAEEPTTPRPEPGRPPNRPPSFPLPGIEVPGIGDIGDLVGGIFKPGKPAKPGPSEQLEPTTPARPPEETTSPPEPTSPAPPPEETTSGGTPPGDAPPGDAPPGDANPDTPPEDTAPEEEAECETRDGEADDETRERGGEDCPEETTSEEEPPSNNEDDGAEDTTGSGPPEAVEDQYEGGQPNPETGSPGPETTSGS